MGHFVAASNDVLDASIRSGILDFPRHARVGIFGVGALAIRIADALRRQGIENIFFAASNPFREYHRGLDLLDIKSPVAMSADYYVVASLARPEELANELIMRGFCGQIIAFPEMKHLSTMLSRDPSTPAKIRSLAGLHVDRPAFIVGAAPSLQSTHPAEIKGAAITLSANGVVRIGEFTPDYYFLLDGNAVRSWAGEVAGLDTTILMASHLVSFYRDYPALRKKSSILFPTCYEHQGDLDVMQWESRGFETGHTVACPMLQFALLMGCNPIYLIGVDLTYGTRGTYFTDRYHAAGVPAYQADKLEGIRIRMLEGIRRSVDACRRHGVEVYNCSPNRNLPFMENRDYSDVIQALRARAG